MKHRLAVFASGEGTNFDAIAHACADGTIDAEVVLMVCDKPSAPVVGKAERMGIKSFVFSPKSYASKAEYEEEIVRRMDAEKVELVCLAGYMRILSDVLLKAYEGRIINIHPSLLPRWRGPSPITAALLARDTQTGLSVQTVDRRMDCGDILYSEKVFLGGRETTESLSVLFSSMAAEAAVCVVENFEEFYRNRTPQDESAATYCRKIRKEDGVIDWTLPAADIDACVRAYYPQPKARSYFNGIELYFLRCDVFDPARLPLSLLETAAEAVPGEIFAYLKPAGFLVKTGGGILSVSELQLKSRKALDAASFKNGSPEIIGARLGSEP